MSYEVKTEAFERPLDLLLHLINRLEIDIYDIKMAEITEQYMEHVLAMRVLSSMKLVNTKKWQLLCYLLKVKCYCRFIKTKT